MHRKCIPQKKSWKVNFDTRLIRGCEITPACSVWGHEYVVCILEGRRCVRTPVALWMNDGRRRMQYGEGGFLLFSAIRQITYTFFIEVRGWYKQREGNNRCSDHSLESIISRHIKVWCRWTMFVCIDRQICVCVCDKNPYPTNHKCNTPW